MWATGPPEPFRAAPGGWTLTLRRCRSSNFAQGHLTGQDRVNGHQGRQTYSRGMGWNREAGRRGPNQPRLSLPTGGTAYRFRFLATRWMRATPRACSSGTLEPRSRQSSSPTYLGPSACHLCTQGWFWYVCVCGVRLPPVHTRIVLIRGVCVHVCVVCASATCAHKDSSHTWGVCVWYVRCTSSPT